MGLVGVWWGWMGKPVGQGWCGGEHRGSSIGVTSLSLGLFFWGPVFYDDYQKSSSYYFKNMHSHIIVLRLCQKQGPSVVSEHVFPK